MAPEQVDLQVDGPRSKRGERAEKRAEAKLKGAQEEIAEYDKQITALEEKIALYRKSLQGMEDKKAGGEDVDLGEMGELELQILDLEEELGGLKKERNKLVVDAPKAVAEDMDRRTDRMEKRFQRLTDAEAERDRIDAELTAAENADPQDRKAIASLRVQLDAAQKEVDGMKVLQERKARTEERRRLEASVVSEDNRLADQLIDEEWPEGPTSGGTAEEPAQDAEGGDEVGEDEQPAVDDGAGAEETTGDEETGGEETGGEETGGETADEATELFPDDMLASEYFASANIDPATQEAILLAYNAETGEEASLETLTMGQLRAAADANPVIKDALPLGEDTEKKEAITLADRLSDAAHDLTKGMLDDLQDTDDVVKQAFLSVKSFLVMFLIGKGGKKADWLTEFDKDQLDLLQAGIGLTVERDGNGRAKLDEDGGVKVEWKDPAPEFIPPMKAIKVYKDIFGENWHETPAKNISRKTTMEELRAMRDGADEDSEERAQWDRLITAMEATNEGKTIEDDALVVDFLEENYSNVRAQLKEDGGPVSDAHMDDPRNADGTYIDETDATDEDVDGEAEFVEMFKLAEMESLIEQHGFDNNTTVKEYADAIGLDLDALLPESVNIPDEKLDDFVDDVFANENLLLTQVTFIGMIDKENAAAYEKVLDEWQETGSVSPKTQEEFRPILKAGFKKFIDELRTGIANGKLEDLLEHTLIKTEDEHNRGYILKALVALST